MVKVSVIILAFRESKLMIERSLKSILNQTLQEIEIIVVINDILNAEVVELLENYELKDNRIKLIKNEKNLGGGISRNIAIKVAISKYIAIQDGDDFSTPERLMLQYNYLETHKNVDATGSGLVYVNENFEQLFKRSYSLNLNDNIIIRSPVGHPSLMARKLTFEKFGYYFEKFQTFKNYYILSEDYDLFLNWYTKGAIIHNLPDFLCIYTKDSKDYFKAKSQIKGAISTKLKYIKYFKFNFKAYTFLFFEYCLSFMPNFVIYKLFILIHLLKK